MNNLLCRPVHSSAQTAQINIKELIVTGDNVVACACINPADARVTLSRQKLENAYSSQAAAESVEEEEESAITCFDLAGALPSPHLPENSLPATVTVKRPTATGTRKAQKILLHSH